MPVVKVEFFDRWKAIETIRAQDKVQGFADCALPDIVCADQQRMSVEFQLGRLDTAKIFNFQQNYFQDINSTVRQNTHMIRRFVLYWK